MEWQTPKVDWAPEDGVLDADFNRIEGNIALLKENADSVSPNVLVTDMTVYVKPSGDDYAGDGSNSAPYRTITRALEVIPKNLSGRSVTINIAAGTYTESVTIEGFDAPINITGVVGASVSVSGLRVSGCTCFVSGIFIDRKSVV